MTGCACGNASGPIGPSVVQLFRVRTLFPITVVCFLSLKVFFLFNSSNTIRVYLDPYMEEPIHEYDVLSYPLAL